MNRIAIAPRIGFWARWGWSVRLRDVLIFALLPFMVGLYVVTAAILDYRRVHQFDDSWSVYLKLDTFFVDRIEAALNLPKMLALQRRLDPEKDDAGVIRLSVPPELWKEWQREPLSLMGQWSNATLLRGNNLNPVKLRKRGDNSVHWVSEKKSFTLGTRKSSLFKGYSRLAFSTKTVLHSYLVARLAREFDLLAPYSTVAPVFVNEKFYGIFRVLELVDESFLRRNGRMPGNIFRGDNAERGEVFKGLPRGLAVNPYIWDRVAKDHQPDSHAEATLHEFLFDSNGTTFDDHLRLMSWVDRDEISRLLALMLIAGDPMHISAIHNNYWYQDPSTGLLHPIPWDIRLLVLDVLQTRHYRINQIFGELFRNPFILDGALRVIHDKVAGDRLFQTAERIAKGAYERYREHFEYDRMREPFIPYSGIPDHALNGLRSNIRLLNEWFEDSVAAFRAEPQPANGMILDFEARGYAGSDLHAIVIDGDMKTAQPVRLVADGNRNGILDPSDQELPGQWTPSPSGGRLALAKPAALLPGIDPEKPGIKPAPIHYRFFLSFSDAGGKVAEAVKVRAELRNRVTGKPPTITEWNAGEAVGASPSWHPWQYPASSPVVHRLQGHTRLRETLIIPKGDALVIEAGATIQMDPDVSILARGRVVARGTSERPITFRPAIERKPWGSIALQSEGADGSEFEHVRFQGGGGTFLERVEYKGMVTVHRVKQITFKNSEFSDNVRSDDALNAVHSNVTIENCVFLRASADAVDFDFSSGRIANNRFEASGNDAIDLMGSAPQIIGNHITGSGDKGISIGEGSSPLVFNNYIARSNRGIEVKDGSEPFLVHNTITQNTIGILQSAKNWRYGSGGWGKLINSAVVQNSDDIKSDKDSRLTNPAPAGARTTPSSSADSAWVLAHYGIRATSNTAGRIDGWTPIKPIAPKVLVTFEDDFEQVADGWVGGGGVSRLEKRDQDFQVAFSKRKGHISRNVDWNLTDPRYTYIAVFELAGRDITSAGISVLSADSEAARAFDATRGLAAYVFVGVELKPGHYNTIKISAVPGASSAKLHLHTYRLYAIPKDEPLG
ncbi:MAG: right-handed parallel beta-helix repeat-containing protein [Candidatus Binatia bacterium]